MSSRSGYRGYIGSRSYRGQNPPQNIQNMVIRNYCQINDFTYLLSATEYHMRGCFIMLEEVMRELSNIEGVVLYSIFMLPRNRDRRHDFVHRILESGATLHGALENITVSDEPSFQRMETILAIRHISTHKHIGV